MAHYVQFSRRLFLWVLTVASIVRWIQGFAFVTPTIGGPTNSSPSTVSQQWRKTTTRMRSSRDEEIAKLEAELRKLKAEQETQADEESTSRPVKSALAGIDEPEKLEIVSGKDMILTEGALIKEKILDDEPLSLGSVLPIVLGLVATGVFLFFFAQVPVGEEDLNKYSAGNSATVNRIDLGDLNPDRKKSSDL